MSNKPGGSGAPSYKSPARIVVKRPNVLESDEKMMKLAISDAGNWCYGIKAIDVWIYNRGRLVSALGGTWVDPVYFQNEDKEIKSALMKLYDTSTPDYMNPLDFSLAPGEGLAGALWADTAGSDTSPTPAALLSQENVNKQRLIKRIKWRDVNNMAEDEDQPFNERIKVIGQAGFGLAAGVPFNVRGRTRGIVIYMARKSVDMDKLTSFLNEEYMFTASQHIGSVLALRKPRELALEERTVESTQAFEKASSIFAAILKESQAESFKSLLSEISEDKMNIEQASGDEVQIKLGDEKTSCNDKLKQKFSDELEDIKEFWIEWWTKMRGGNVKPPPGMPNKMVVFAMCAAFITVFIMAIINASLRNRFGSDLGFELGQIGGLSTLVFTMSAAPGAQPQSIFYAQTICMLVGMTFAHIPHEGVLFDTPLEYLRVAGSVSVACAFMAKFGIVHPPGGGLAVIFLRYGWNNIKGFEKMGMLLLQDVIFIGIASIINNLNTSKGYPTYWGTIPNLFTAFVKKHLCNKKVKPKDA